MAGTYARVILIESYIQYPMQRVFNSPMLSDYLCSPLRIGCYARQVISQFRCLLFFDFANCFNHDQAFQVAPFVKAGDPVRSLDAPATASFCSPVIIFDAFGCLDRTVGIVVFDNSFKDSFDLGMKLRMVLFQRQYVVCLLLPNLVGDFFLRIERIDRDDAAFYFKESE